MFASDIDNNNKNVNGNDEKKEEDDDEELVLNPASVQGQDGQDYQLSLKTLTDNYYLYFEM